jgi:vitamin B12 transporter
VNKQNFEHKTDKLKYQTEGIFVSNSNTFDKLVLTQALRYDNNSKFDEKVTGKIGTKYNFTDDLNTSANYGTAYNAPTLSNLSYTPTLKPETSESFDVGLEYKNFKVTYFENIITDMINYISGSNPVKYENLNGETTLKGYEFAYKKDVLKDTFLNLNYTLLDTEDNKGQELARRPKDQVGFGVDYYGIDKFQFNVNGQYIGERYDGANKTGAETGNYTVWNSVVNYEINKTYSTYLKVDNLFDKYYQTIDGYATAERSAYAGLKAKF